MILPFTQVTASDSIFPGDAGIERFPALLTDGSRLYFSKIEGGRVALAYSAISGGAANPLVTPPEIGSPRLADISPDGSKLLVIGETLTELERTMWVVPSTGGAARKIVSGLGHDGTWMPDGNTIIYASGQNILITHNDAAECAGFDFGARQGILASLCARRLPLPLHGGGFGDPCHVVVGIYVRGQQAAPSIAGLDPSERGMLRKLDAGREGLRIPVESRGGQQYLDAARENVDEAIVVGAHSTHRRAVELPGTGTRSPWEPDILYRRPQAESTPPLRCRHPQVHALPARNQHGGTDGVFQRRYPGCLDQHFGWVVVAKPAGWVAAFAIDRPSHACIYDALVSGFPLDRIHGEGARQDMESLFHLYRGGPAADCFGRDSKPG